MSNIEKYNKSIDLYYKMKEKYEAPYLRKKIDIIKQDIPTEQKKEKISQIIRKCVVCKKNGGMVFKRENGIISAECGANEPCKLNLKMKLAKFERYEKAIDELKYKIEKVKSEIIKLKLDLLFGFQTEDYTMNKFENLSNTLSKKETKRLNLEKQYNEKNNNFKLEFNGETSDYNRTESIKLLNGHVENLLKQYRNNINEYHETNNKQFLYDAFELYNDGLKKTLDKLDNIKYQTRFVENMDITPFYKENAPPNKVFNVKITDENNEIMTEKYKILSSKNKK